MAHGRPNLHTLVIDTGGPARIDEYAVVASGPTAAVVRRLGLRAGVAVPIRVEGRLWGVMIAASTRQESIPAGIEARLAGFTELVATALANAQARTELRGFADDSTASHGRRPSSSPTGGACRPSACA